MSGKKSKRWKERLSIKGRDVIIKGINGEIYPINIEIFKKTYEVIDSFG